MDRAAVGLDDGAHDRQAQPAATAVPVARLLETGEPVEHPVPLGLGDRAARRCRPSDDHVAPVVRGRRGRRRPSCVEPRCPRGCGWPGEPAGSPVTRAAAIEAVTGKSTVARSRRDLDIDQVVEIDVLQRQRKAVVGLGQGQQVVDEAAACAAPPGRDDLVAARVVLRSAWCRGDVDGGADRGQRAAQLVGRVADEPPRRGVRLLQPVEHEVHGLGQPGDLVARWRNGDVARGRGPG